MSAAHEISLVPEVRREETELKLAIVEPGMLEANLPTAPSISLSVCDHSNGSPDSILSDSPSAQVVGQLLSRTMDSTT
jgi:hypothetical protein